MLFFKHFSRIFQIESINCGVLTGWYRSASFSKTSLFPAKTGPACVTFPRRTLLTLTFFFPNFSFFLFFFLVLVWVQSSVPDTQLYTFQVTFQSTAFFMILALYFFLQPWSFGALSSHFKSSHVAICLRHNHIISLYVVHFYNVRITSGFVKTFTFSPFISFSFFSCFFFVFLAVSISPSLCGSVPFIDASSTPKQNWARSRGKKNEKKMEVEEWV